MVLSHSIVGAAIEVHRYFGSGLLESVYEAALYRELSLRGVTAERQVHVPLIYKSLPLDLSMCLDLVVERLVVVEVKSVDRPASDPPSPSPHISQAHILPPRAPHQLQCGAAQERNQTTPERVTGPFVAFVSSW